MWRAYPVGWFLPRYSVEEEGLPLAMLEFGAWSERGAIVLDGQRLRIEREGFWHPSFHLRGACAAIWHGLIDECYYQKALHRLRPVRGFNPRVMVELLHHWSSLGFLSNFVTQASIAHLTREKLEEVPMSVPQVDEQAAIVAVLSDMDSEIVGLEQRLTKTRALKQGVMQELLTGRTRLV